MKANAVVKNEAELCLLMEEHLRDLKWDLYKEVTMHTGIIDIVAKQGQVLWAVEAKMTAGLGLLEQATERLRYCHRVSVVVPSRVSGFFQRLCRREGIGIFKAEQRSTYFPSLKDYQPLKFIHEIQPAKLRRNVLGVKLMEGMRETSAGFPSPLRVTPFSMTCDSIRRTLKDKPEGVGLKDLIESISHHYNTPSSARSSLATWMRSGAVKGVRYENGRAYLCVESPTTPASGD